MSVTCSNKTDRHDKTEILLKVAVNTINQNQAKAEILLKVVLNKLLNITVLFIWYLLASLKKMSLAKHGELFFILASNNFGECLKKMVSHTVYSQFILIYSFKKNNHLVFFDNIELLIFGSITHSRKTINKSIITSIAIRYVRGLLTGVLFFNRGSPFFLFIILFLQFKKSLNHFWRTHLIFFTIKYIIFNINTFIILGASWNCSNSAISNWISL